MNLEIEKEILVEERLRMETEKLRLSEEMEMFKERMKELYIEDMIRRDRERENKEYDYLRYESRLDSSEVTLAKAIL